MSTRDTLNKEFSKQFLENTPPFAEKLEAYKLVARHYAQLENALAILSDLCSNTSYICYGGFARTLGIGSGRSEDTVPSIWEEEILKLILPDDLASKYLQELCFSHFVEQPTYPKTYRLLPGKQAPYENANKRLCTRLAPYLLCNGFSR